MTCEHLTCLPSLSKFNSIQFKQTNQKRESTKASCYI